MKKLNKNVIALIVAVVLALVCALLLKVLIDKKISSSLDTKKVSYVVANADLKSGITIDPFDKQAFAVRSDIPAEFAQSNAITPDQAEAIKGGLLLANLKRGDIVTWQMVNTDERKQLANRLQPGRRALTIPVNDQSSIASMLKPNDHIDLILSYEKHGINVAAPLLQNVRVIATGDTVSNTISRKEGGSNKYANITLDLSIDEVSKVTTALDLGKISAVLRNPDDTSFTDKVISLGTLQQELNLRNTIPQPKNPERANVDWDAIYEKQLANIKKEPTVSPSQDPKADKEEKKAAPSKSANDASIHVIYGNKADKKL